MIHNKMDQSLARGMGSRRHELNSRRRTREGPEPACVQTPFCFEVAHAGREGRMNILPWYRLVGVAKTSSETQRRKSRAARKGKWPPRGTGTTVLTFPRSAPRGTGKVVKTVNIQVRWAAAQPGQDRQLPSVATHSRL